MPMSQSLQRAKPSCPSEKNTFCGKNVVLGSSQKALRVIKGKIQNSVGLTSSFSGFSFGFILNYIRNEVLCFPLSVRSSEELLKL
jgi:hypothetical protein